MEAREHQVISVLGDQRRFVVPIFQRQYRWGMERLQPFWEDVVAKADELMSGGTRFDHYMGALILAPGSDGFVVGSTPKVQVVDGQQRLTTFQLFLVAFRDVSVRLGNADLGESIKSYLFIPKMSNDGEALLRLLPTREDRASFSLIVNNGIDGARQQHTAWFFKNGKPNGHPDTPPSVLALSYFDIQIESFARFGLVDDEEKPTASDDGGADLVRKRLEALIQALLNHLKLVVITLNANDDAQVIFETLNSKAEPLLAMDLVRNNIFHRASTQGEKVEALFDNKWAPFEEDRGFWQSDSPRAKPRRPRIDHFLSHALTAQTGEETSLRELYSEYRAFMRPNGKPRFQSVEAELDALIVYRPVYRMLETAEGTTSLARLGAKLNLWEVSTAYPLVFRVATSDVEDEEKARIYALIYSYLVRRAICDLTAKNLNKTFARLVAEMIEHGASVATFTNFFARQQGDATRFPSDDDFEAAIVNKPAYALFRRKERLAEMLWELERALRTKFSVNTPRPENMSIEHVLPQAWPENWCLTDGRTAPGDKQGVDDTMRSAIAERESVLHTLGNLTLITVPANTVASNQAFVIKKKWLEESLLALNMQIRSNEIWNEAKIRDRSRMLADMAVMIWPAPSVVASECIP